MYKYYVSYDGKEGSFKEVTLEDFIKAERAAGFSGPGHFAVEKYAATNGFGKTERGTDGKIDYTIRGEVHYVRDGS